MGLARPGLGTPRGGPAEGRGGPEGPHTAQPNITFMTTLREPS